MKPMKVPARCAVALALFHLASALPAPTAAPGELGIIKFGLDINEAHVLRPRQSSVVSVPIPPVDRSSTRSAPADTSSSEQPATPSSAYQPLVVYQCSQFSPFPSFTYERTTFLFLRPTLGSNVQAQLHQSHPHLTLNNPGCPHID